MGQCKSCTNRSMSDLVDGVNQFTVTVSREADQKLGVELDFMDEKTGRVIELDPDGALAKAGTNLKQGDHIIAVNGSSTATRIMTRMKEDLTIEMLVERPVEFRIEVVKGADGVGLDLTHAPRGDTLVIRNLTSKGAIKEWNEKKSAAQVRRLDRIVEVNTIRGPAATLIEELMKEDKLSITISPAPKLIEENLDPVSVQHSKKF